MKTYRIEVTTNAYIAARSAMFERGKTVAILEEGLTLREAQTELLSLYNRYNDTYYTNWGVAVMKDKNSHEGACKTFFDGTRCFNWDSRIFKIEKENESV